MKFRISFKTPDAIDYAINDATGDDSCGDPEHAGGSGMCLDCELTSDQNRELADKMRACAEKFIEYGECLVVEFDTDTGTCVVIPVK